LEIKYFLTGPRLDGDLEKFPLYDELSVLQATFLIHGVIPSLQNMQTWPYPAGFAVTEAALLNALRSGRIKGRPITLPSQGGDEGALSSELSTIEIDSLKEWLVAHGRKPQYIFRDTNSAPEYPPKLAAAVRAWKATRGKTPAETMSEKQFIMEWLRDHAKELGLCKKDGKVNLNAIEEIAAVANSDLKGGRPRTRG
jgi:hypothetical protein